MEDLGYDIEVLLFFGGLLEFGGLGVSKNVAGGKVLVGPFLQGGSNGSILSLLGGVLVRVSVRLISSRLTEWGELV